MRDFAEPTDPPGGWQREHLQRYIATNGAEGHEWNGVRTLLLTTIGRRTGRGRRTPLIYGKDGDRYLVVASAGGNPVAPEWYRNLAVNPRVAVQVGSDRFVAMARTATGAEKPRLWRVMTAIWPSYDEYQTKTDREIAVVILERVGEPDAAA